MGKRGGVSYRLVPQSEFPTVLKDAPLTATSRSGRTLDGLPSRSSGKASIIADSSSNTLTKRSADECSFVEATCSQNPPCGIMPLYLASQQEYGVGVYPWHVSDNFSLGKVLSTCK